MGLLSRGRLVGPPHQAVFTQSGGADIARPAGDGGGPQLRLRGSLPARKGPEPRVREHALDRGRAPRRRLEASNGSPSVVEDLRPVLIFLSHNHARGDVNPHPVGPPRVMELAASGVRVNRSVARYLPAVEAPHCFGLGHAEADLPKSPVGVAEGKQVSSDQDEWKAEGRSQGGNK